MQNKDTIRKDLKQKRLSLSPSVLETQAKALLQHFENFASPLTWLLYYPIHNEISPLPLFEWAQSRGDLTAFPKVLSETEMEFQYVSSLKELKKTKWGFEPQSKNKINNFDKCVVIIPGVAFQNDGNRLGYGKGFYDRFLEKNPQIMRIGIGYDFQLIQNTWKSSAHDQCVDRFICPSGAWGSIRPGLRFCRL